MRREEMRDRLLSAAESVLAREGAQGASVRAITGAAGVNVASVTTAFGGRGALLDALFVRLIEPVNRERERRYAKLRSPGDIDGVLRAFIEPLTLVAGSQESALSALLSALLTDADPSRRPLDRILLDPGIAELDARLAAILPHVSAQERGSRIRLAMGTMVAAAALSAVPFLSEPAGTEGMLRFVAAGLVSPAPPGR